MKSGPKPCPSSNPPLEDGRRARKGTRERAPKLPRFPRSFYGALLGLAACLAAPLSLAASSRHGSKHPKRPRAHLARPGPPHTPASRYAALTASACHAELTRRGIKYRVEAAARGVKIPVRVFSPIGGVTYRTDLPERQRHQSPWEVFDCRLVLALDDFGKILTAHDIVEARIFSAWRPPPRNSPGDVAKRHQAALAVDVRTLKKKSGEELVVLDHFDGSIGSPVCNAPRDGLEPKGRELRELVCGAADAHLFNSILTPNFDARHANHFHLELAPGKDWFLLR